MEACAVICGKAAVALPDANFLSSWCQSPSSRAQNRGFCALLGLGTLVFRHFEHKIGVFVRFWGLEPTFSGISSTKSAFLCAFALRNPHFLAFRAQNRGFCALFAFGTPIFGLFEHKIGIFVRFGGATAGATARSNGSNESNRSYGSYGNNQSNGNNRSNRNDGRDSLGC